MSSCKLCRRKCIDKRHRDYYIYLVYDENGLTFSETGKKKYGEEFLKRIIMIEQHPLKKKLEATDKKILRIHAKLRPLIKQLEKLETDQAYYKNEIYEQGIDNNEPILSQEQIPTHS